MEKPIIETPKKQREQPDISPPKIVDNIKKRGLDCEQVEEETVKRTKKEYSWIEDENNEHAHVVKDDDNLIDTIRITKCPCDWMDHCDNFEYVQQTHPITDHNIIKLIHATHNRPKIQGEPAASCVEIFQRMVVKEGLEIKGHHNKHYNAGEHKFVWMGCQYEGLSSSRYGHLLFEIDPKFLQQLPYKKCELGTRKFSFERSHTILFHTHNKVLVNEDEKEIDNLNFFEDKLIWKAPQFKGYTTGRFNFDHPEIAILADSIHIAFDLVKIRFVEHKPKFCYHQKTKKGFYCECEGREADMLNFFSELASIIKEDSTSIPKEVGLCFYETDIAEIKQKLSEDDMKVLVEHFGWSV